MSFTFDDLTQIIRERRELDDAKVLHQESV